ncbi:MAG: hypothetical protein ABSH51_18905 [Solirubrobacteraceae bacterium]
MSALIARRGTDVLVGVALAALTLVLFGELPKDFNVDSWLALVTGRLVWDSGIPHHETLTVMSHGAVWIDQQWLSQLASYAIYRVGGLALLGIVNIALLVGPVAAATYAGRGFGAPFRSVLLALPACLTMVAPAREIRTQEFAMPLFLATVYLLASDSRRPSRRVLWCLPILVLWANLHGSVTLGAALVVLRGLTMLWERRGAALAHAQAWRRPLALIAGAPLAILLTPYGTAIIGYYRATMAGSTLRQFVTEWQPITSMPVIAVALFLVAGVTLWSFGRNPGKTTVWEKLAFLALVVGSISVVRNALFCGLFALMIVPVSWAYGPGPEAEPAVDRRRAVINATLGLLAIGLVGAAVAAALARPDSVVEYSTQQPKLLTAVERATRADPSLRVLSDDHFTDWLLWRDPALSGRIANDVRFELLSAQQLTALQSVFDVVGTDWKRAAHGYRLLVLLRTGDADSVRAFLHEPGHRVLYDSGSQIVILRSVRQARQE